MLKGINVTWKPKLKKVVMFKKVGNDINRAFRPATARNNDMQ